MFLRLLPTIGASIATIWIAAFITMPHKPLPNNEVEELVYARLLGRQQRVLFLAIIVTVLGFFALVLSLPSSLAAHGKSDAPRQQVCFNISGSPPTCYTPQPGGDWLEEEWQANGTWRVIGMSSAVPRPPGEKDANP
jgi:hypothetical protein